VPRGRPLEGGGARRCRFKTPVVDGNLLRWREIEHEYDWRTLLLGNGLSINVSPRFDYRSLYQQAVSLGDGVLAPADRALFAALGTENFERVLRDLSASIRVQASLGEDPGPLRRRYRSVQGALAAAIRAVHVPWRMVPAATLQVIQSELRRYDSVYTTNYDLLVYWAMGHDDSYDPLVDCFWGPSGRFDPGDSKVRAGATAVFFLHGAMHLVAEGSGVTRKLRREDTETLLGQFGRPIAGDPNARPLLVTEGSSRDKRRAIESNNYLAHVYTTLRSPRLDGPILVFGSSLGEHDRHLTDALSVHPARPVAVSMMPSSCRRLCAEQARIFARLEAEPLLFFDATTHPLGAPSLAAQPRRLRRAYATAAAGSRAFGRRG
jgi:hypothetical protein